MSQDSSAFSVVIVGGGFCGTMTAVHLLRLGARPLALVERGREPGLGAAYGTEDAAHLLNVSASDMSAFAGEPEHFLRWLRRENPETPPGVFAPRRVYGAYLKETLREAASKTVGGLEIVRDSAVAVRAAAGEAVIILQSGRRLRAEKVVLALGNFPPAFPISGSPAPAAGGRYIADPWSPALERVGAEDSVLLIGTGLTMADVVVSLNARGHRGPIRAVSRHGLLPRPHRPFSPASDVFEGRAPKTAREALKRLRDAAAIAWAKGSDWRALLASLRPRTQELWRSWPAAERRRFLRHLRAHWDVHRHRLPPEIYAVLDELGRSGRLKVTAGRLLSLEAGTDGVSAVLKPRHEDQPAAVRADWCVNCAGPEPALSKTSDLLARDLLDQGLARPDALGLGFDADDAGALRDAGGKASALLFTLGPALKGGLWETVAVPELRGQALALAKRLAGAKAASGGRR